MDDLTRGVPMTMETPSSWNWLNIWVFFPTPSIPSQIIFTYGPDGDLTGWILSRSCWRTAPHLMTSSTPVDVWKTIGVAGPLKEPKSCKMSTYRTYIANKTKLLCCPWMTIYISIPIHGSYPLAIKHAWLRNPDLCIDDCKKVYGCAWKLCISH